MTKLLQTLYTYASENRLVYSPEEKLQIREYAHMSDSGKEKIMKLLSDEGKVLFENYIRKEELLQGMELEAIFRAGLSIGLELSRQ